MFLYSTFNEYWNLYHKVTFDGERKIISINPGELILDVQRDVYSAWKEWSMYEDNLKYLPALNTVGGEPTVAGQRLDVTYFLINGWKFQPFPGSYTLNIIGNIFDINGEDIKIPAEIVSGLPNNISINTTTSVIVRQLDSNSTSEGGGLLPDERSALFNIEDVVVEIRSIFDQPVVATLETSQAEILDELKLKLTELWRIHGLDRDEPMVVSKTGRTVADIDQTFDRIDDDTVMVTRDI
jgi:hypothetical protein